MRYVTKSSPPPFSLLGEWGFPWAQSDMEKNKDLDPSGYPGIQSCGLNFCKPIGGFTTVQTESVETFAKEGAAGQNITQV